jgi:hypothetical protein
MGSSPLPLGLAAAAVLALAAGLAGALLAAAVLPEGLAAALGLTLASELVAASPPQAAAARTTNDRAAGNQFQLKLFCLLA